MQAEATEMGQDQVFNPRTQVWTEHFEWVTDGTRLRGRSPTGRVTIERLKINQDRVVDARALWVSSGLHPPQ